MITLEDIRKNTHIAKVRQDMAVKDGFRRRELRELLSGVRDHLLVAQDLAQQEALAVQNQLKFSIQDIVNDFLDVLFPDEYVFQVVFEVKHNKTEARLVVLDHGEEIDVLEQAGGGLADTIATGLRLALLCLSKRERVLILDEPAKNIDAERKPLFFEALSKLALELGIQVIAVTHDQTMIDVANKAVRIVKVGQISKVA